MSVTHNNVPDPIMRNRRERRLAWVFFVLLIALAWYVSPIVLPGTAAPSVEIPSRSR